MKIIDISHWNGTIDFSKVKKDGYEAVIMKCTQGVAMFDNTFAKNKANARKAGLLCGFYHFANGGDVAKEADWFMKNVGELQEGELLVLDFEIDIAKPAEWCKAWLDRVSSKMGFKPLLYSNEARIKAIDFKIVSDADYGLWIAKYGDNDDKAEANEVPNTDEWKFYAIWQFSSTGKVSGISGRVDLNTTDMDLKTLKKYGKPAGDAESDPKKDYSVNLYKIFGAVEALLGRADGPNPSDEETESILEDLAEVKKRLDAPQIKTVTVEKPVEKIVYKDSPETLAKIENQRIKIKNLLENKSIFYQKWVALKKALIEFWNASE